MAISRVKTWVAAEVLTAADLNAEFNNILNNPVDLWSPAAKGVDFDGQALTMDAAAATTIASPATRALTITPGAKTGTPGTAGSVIDVVANTFTDNNTAVNGTAAAWVGTAIQRPTLGASNTGVTTTDAATLYIPNSPAAGTNQTLTRALALWIDAGIVRWDDPIALGGGVAPTLGTIGGSGPATAAQNQWLRVNINGTTMFLPVWA